LAKIWKAIYKGLAIMKMNLMLLLSALILMSNAKPTVASKDESKRISKPAPSRMKLVWMSLDGFQPEALSVWTSKIKNPHPRGLIWLLKSARGRQNFKVINPTITAPSHISTITCAGAGAHGILDNNTWTGQGTTSGFNKPYAPENWVARLRASGFRVGTSLYPSIDGVGEARSSDAGIFYDNPGSTPQILSVVKGVTVGATIPDREQAEKKYPIELTANAEGVVSVKTPWGAVSALELAKPVDVFFTTKIGNVDRRASVSFMLLSQELDISVEVSPIQIMPSMAGDFRDELDRANLTFSALRDYRFQSKTKPYLASMKHRRRDVVRANRLMLAKGDLDALFLYFEDLDALLHAYYKDQAVESEVVQYIAEFDRDLGSILSMIPRSADLVVLGDHGMSAIAYVLNARKILTEEIAAQGTVMTGGGALYLYPPQGDVAQDPPATLNLERVAETLRGMQLDLTGRPLFGKVIVRGSPEAEAEGLIGKQVPWLMAFAGEGVAFKNSVEDKFLLARAKWSPIPQPLQAKYPEPLNNGVLATPVPSGQHGHWNELSQMRTKLVLEGPKVSKIPAHAVEKTLQLLPAVADAVGWPRPASCAK
jgi:hypothetical protein